MTALIDPKLISFLSNWIWGFQLLFGRIKSSKEFERLINDGVQEFNNNCTEPDTLSVLIDNYSIGRKLI